MFHHVSSLSEFRLETIESGTRLTKTAGLPSGPFFGVLLGRLATSMSARFIRRAFETFKHDIEADYRDSGRE